jgi:ribosomal-protein-serine acetyltransferase
MVCRWLMTKSIDEVGGCVKFGHSRPSYPFSMTRCASEHEHPDAVGHDCILLARGLTWRPPRRLAIRVETPRLVVRGYELDDAPAVFEAINTSREHLTPWLPWVDEHRELAGSVRYIASQVVIASDPSTLAGVGARRDERPGPLLGLGVGIFEREGGAFVGGTGFNDVRPTTASAETGYWICADRAGRGYCAEAMRHWLSWLLSPQEAGLGLVRVRIYCSSANEASKRIPEKLELRREVHQRSDYHVPGIGVTDRLGWGVLADEWDCARHAMRI